MSRDLRRHIRMFLDAGVFVELDSGAAGDGAGRQIVLCKTLDVSYGGLKVSLGKALLTGAILQIGIEFPGIEEALHLVVEVKWCRENGDPDTGWCAGLQVIDSGDTDIEQWRELMAHT